jgi:superfamily II DNA or RNA helicase
MELRHYQLAALADVRAAFATGRKRVLLRLPTGGGKTVIAAEMLRVAAERGHRCVFLAHRRELIQQASERLGDVHHGVIMAGEPATEAPVQVASVQTLARREPPPCDFLFVDEAHRTLGASYLRLIEALRPRWLVGLTATPYRTDGRGLGAVYDALVDGPSTLELTEQGYLVPCDVYAPTAASMLGASVTGGDYTADELEERVNRPAITGDVVATWQQRAAGHRTVVFGVSVAHATALREAFLRAGVTAAVLTGETPHNERRAMLDALAGGALQIVTSCATLTEGWDSPAVSCACVVRPTLSRGLWRQMVGRVLRTAPGKTRAIVLDHGGNAWRHGHPYAPDPVALDATATRWNTDREPPPAVRVCPTCFGVYYRETDTTCPYCGAVAPVRERKPQERRGELERIDWSQAPHHGHDESRARKAAEALKAKAAERGYAPGWVFMQLRLRYGPTRAKELMSA